MFAIPGVACLIVFILVRPQEFLPLLQRIPFLHLFTVLCAFGWMIDIRLRRLQPLGTPALPWVIGFVIWAMVCTAVVVPDTFVTQTIELMILFTLYATIAHGVQRFRTFQAVATVIVATLLFVTFVCFHQGLAHKECIAGQESAGEVTGHPDGRVCESIDRCFAPDAEPGMEYRCEHVGLVGTYSVGGRIRYRGKLQDPNEVSLAMIAGGLSLLVGFARRRKSGFGLFACVVGIALIVATIFLSQSRGGLISMMIVLGIYAIRRYGLWMLVPSGLLGIVVLAVGGRSGDSADTSTQLRYEAWATGFTLFKEHPIVGVGAGAFGQHHYLTAHNSFVLALAETGFIGLCLFTTIIYVTLKSLVVGLLRLSKVPGSEVAQVWGMALLASMIAVTFQINTLSFVYHPLLWIFLGLVGAWSGAIRHHAPEHKVDITLRDAAFILIGCAFYAVILLPLFLRYKGEL